MRIDIITCQPLLLSGPLDHSIVGRARKAGIAEIHIHNLHDHSPLKHRQVDDYPFGGGGGMVMRIEPIANCLRMLQGEREYDEVLYTSPDGEPFTQNMANEFATRKNLIILCGHYKGVDQRVRDHFVTREVSMGDFVLTGGELVAATIADAVIRLLPGAISDEVSALTDSFQDGLLGPPVYTRPAEYEGLTVPDVLTSGHQAKIEEWRFAQQVERTKRLRPDLMEGE